MNLLGDLHARPDSGLEQQRAAEELEAELTSAAGGLLRAQDVRRLLGSGHGGHSSAEGATVPGALLHVDMAGERLFPACQFEGARVLEGIPEVLEAALGTDGWRILQFLVGTPDGLGGRRPIDLLRHGGPEDRNRVIAFAHTLED